MTSGQFIYNSKMARAGEEDPGFQCAQVQVSYLSDRHLVEISNRLWAPGAGLSQVDIVGCDRSRGQGEVGPRKES